MAYREEMGAKDEGFRGLGLTSRKNLCLHPEVRASAQQFLGQVLILIAYVRRRSAGRKRARSSTHDVVI